MLAKPCCVWPPQNEKAVLFINTAELTDELFLVCVYEFVKDNGISAFFSDESQSKIISAIRSDLTQAGLQFDKDTAWSFFLGYVTHHCMVVLPLGISHTIAWLSFLWVCISHTIAWSFFLGYVAHHCMVVLPWVCRTPLHGRSSLGMSHTNICLHHTTGGLHKR